MRFSEVGCDVWVGDFHACNARIDQFPLALHVWSDLNKREGRACRAVVEGRAHGLPIVYSEAQSLATMSVPTMDVLRYCAKPGRLLVHCAGGSCRSPALAVLALVARGVRPHAAVSWIWNGVWEGSGVYSSLQANIINEIFAVAGLPCPWESPPTGRDWP